MSLFSYANICLSQQCLAVEDWDRASDWEKTTKQIFRINYVKQNPESGALFEDRSIAVEWTKNNVYCRGVRPIPWSSLWPMVVITLVLGVGHAVRTRSRPGVVNPCTTYPLNDIKAGPCIVSVQSDCMVHTFVNNWSTQDPLVSLLLFTLIILSVIMIQRYAHFWTPFSQTASLIWYLHHSVSSFWEFCKLFALPFASYRFLTFKLS